jgi:Protein of unknown function (DUF3096)
VAEGRVVLIYYNLNRIEPIKDAVMNIHLSLAPLVALIAGILILVMPRLLNFIVAIYLIIIGLIGLFGTGHFLK